MVVKGAITDNAYRFDLKSTKHFFRNVGKIDF